MKAVRMQTMGGEVAGATIPEEVALSPDNVASFIRDLLRPQGMNEVVLSVTEARRLASATSGKDDFLAPIDNFDINNLIKRMTPRVGGESFDPDSSMLFVVKANESGQLKLHTRLNSEPNRTTDWNMGVNNHDFGAFLERYAQGKFRFE